MRLAADAASAGGFEVERRAPVPAKAAVHATGGAERHDGAADACAARATIAAAAEAVATRAAGAAGEAEARDIEHRAGRAASGGSAPTTTTAASAAAATPEPAA